MRVIAVCVVGVGGVGGGVGCGFFFNDTATTEIYTLSLHDALPICCCTVPLARPGTPDRDARDHFPRLGLIV